VNSSRCWPFGSVTLAVLALAVMYGYIVDVPRSQKRKKTIKLPAFFHFWDRAKAARRTLMKLTPVLNFINVLHTAFTCPDPESVKRY